MSTSVFLLVVAGATPAQADEPLQQTVELSDAQLDLNQRAIEFISQGNLEQAAQLFESSLALGPTNITYLNLGRTKARLGLCTDAAEIYGAVESAPRVPEPSAVEIAERLERYRQDLANCGAQLVFQCEPADLEVQVDGADPLTCPVEPVRVDAGSHHVVAIGANGQRREQDVNVGPGDKVQMVLVVETPKTEPPKQLKPPPTTLQAETVRVLDPTVKAVGWGLVGTGATLFLTAAVLDWFVITPSVTDYQRGATSQTEYDRLRGLQKVNRVLLPLGAAMGATGGATLLFWPRKTVDKGAELSLGVRATF